VDQHRLDRLAVRLAERRSVLRLVAGAPAILLGAAAGDAVAARRRRLHATCRAHKECRSGRCRRHRCACPVELESCGGACCTTGEYCCNPLTSTCAPIGGGCGGGEDDGGCDR
jgi:hypothetical protein